MIKASRKKKGLTQRTLAKRLNVTQSYISKIEGRKITSLSIQFILELSKVLDLCPTEVFIFLTAGKCCSCGHLKCHFQDKYK